MNKSFNGLAVGVALLVGAGSMEAFPTPAGANEGGKNIGQGFGTETLGCESMVNPDGVKTEVGSLAVRTELVPGNDSTDGSPAKQNSAVTCKVTTSTETHAVAYNQTLPTATTSPANPSATACQNQGYELFDADGRDFGFGTSKERVSILTNDNLSGLKSPIVGGANAPNQEGYWRVSAKGHILTAGEAVNHGSLEAFNLNKPIVGMASTPTGKGYWMVASDGGVFAFGDAQFHGSTGGINLNKPIVGINPTPSGGGYWLVAKDGGVFAYGDAKFKGSTGGVKLNEPVVGMTASDSVNGYWLVAKDGGVFAYGDAKFKGSTGGIHLNKPVVGIAAKRNGDGYRLAGADGGVFTFGNAAYCGDATSQIDPRLNNNAIVAIDDDRTIKVQLGTPPTAPINSGR